MSGIRRAIHRKRIELSWSRARRRMDRTHDRARAQDAAHTSALPARERARLWRERAALLAVGLLTAAAVYAVVWGTAAAIRNR